MAWLLGQEDAKKLIERRTVANSDKLPLRLLMAGWAKYEALKKARVDTSRVLMAMQFGDADLDRAVSECFKPAVERAGFELRLLTEKQPAGLIDDQLRVALRTSRFVIADLSHGNKGAYWEGGFAEGLGRPVIYTCRKEAWDKQKTHFDTNHLVTIFWDIEDLPKAGEQLTATIRATLPAEARMEDA